MEFRINRTALPNELFLGEEIDVEVALVDTSQDSFPLISTVVMELSLRAVNDETGDELVMNPFLSPPCISGGACHMKISLCGDSLNNLRSCGHRFTIVVSACQYSLVGKSPPILIIRARLCIDNWADTPSVFYKDAKKSTITFNLSLRDRYNQVVDEFVELRLMPMYEERDERVYPHGISPVSDCSVLHVMGESRYLHRGRGIVDVRLVEHSRTGVHNKRRFIVQILAADTRSGISSVLSKPVEVQAKDHKTKNQKDCKGHKRKDHKHAAPCVQRSVEQSLPTPKQEPQCLALLPRVVAEYVVSQLRSFRWEEGERPEGCSGRGPFYCALTNPNPQIDALQKGLRAFLAGDGGRAFLDGRMNAQQHSFCTALCSDSAPPCLEIERWNQERCNKELEGCGDGFGICDSICVSQESQFGEELFGCKQVERRCPEEQSSLSCAAFGEVDLYDKCWYMNFGTCTSDVKIENTIKKESLKLETPEGLSRVRSNGSSVWDELFPSLDEVATIDEWIEDGWLDSLQDSYESSKSRKRHLDAMVDESGTKCGRF